MKTFNTFRKSITEDVSFMDSTPLQGTLDHSGRPCVYLEKSSCFTPVSEDFSGFPDISAFANTPHTEPKDDLHDWQNENHHEDHAEELGRNLHDHQKTGAYDDSNPDHNAIASYTDESQPLNTKLFKSHLNGTPVTQKLKLDTALDKHKLPEDIHTYSGTGFDPGAMASKHPEGHIHLPAFTSTSLSRNTATNFAQSVGEVGGVSHHHILDFGLKRGQKGMYVGHDDNVGHDEQLSQTPHEKEFLMPRNTTIKVHPVPKVIHDEANNRKYHIWSAHVVDNNE